MPGLMTQWHLSGNWPKDHLPVAKHAAASCMCNPGFRVQGRLAKHKMLEASAHRKPRATARTRELVAVDDLQLQSLRFPQPMLQAPLLGMPDA